MQYSLRTDKEKESVCLSDAEFARQPERETGTPRLAAKDVLQPRQPEEPPTIARSEDAMAVSVPGSEYWLP
jgi:hypothetical protein